jgi:hypothetical protein
MKLLASILLILFFGVAAAAQQTSNVYSVIELMGYEGQANMYAAVVSTVVDKTQQTNIPSDGDFVIITTSDCTHRPKGPETGIVVNGPNGRSLLFSSGASCTVVDITVAR